MRAGLVFLALCLAAPALADEAPFGTLDFTRLTKPQAEFFWKRLKSLAVEEAVLSYCGQPDAFAAAATQGIRACVTAEAIKQAEGVFKSESKATEVDLRKRKASCRGKPEANRGWLGVEIKPVAEGGKGALVTGAVADSPAAAAGLKAGDVVESVNGAAVAEPKDLSAKIRNLRPGATVELGVSGRTLNVTLGAMAFDAEGRAALDMPALVTASAKDLKSVADEVTSMCLQCKTSIWAAFCR